MTPTLLRLLCLCAGLGAYLCSSGLLRLNEVFFQSSTAPSSDLNALLDDQQELDAAYDRLVVVLIDALRADMVLGSAAMHGVDDDNKHQLKGELNAHMPFASNLVTSGRALGYVAHASVPTVTMPRLKALVTGKAPAFIDILKNFNSAALDEDANLVSLLTKSGKRIVFYGDDTWLKLFPEMFERSDGTSGFYTRDTVEVDNNVTRHLSEELDPAMQNEKSGDWDVLVLHYLGLDHVGHLRGPRSPLMKDKLQEMDGVMKLVVDSVGNHGGATLEESSALLMFMRGDAFFALGNSHLVTTIDISQSYHGLSSYSQSLVGALTFVSVFSGPLVYFVNLFQWLDATSVTPLTSLTGPSTQSFSNTRRTACLTIFTYQTLRFAVYTVVVYFMRFHLFIWSVFAPKMLYEFAHLAVSLVLVVLLSLPANVTTTNRK
ncbi:hypothetical protein JG688_00001828 [Phytophthora aleatoria]|uniref:GPI ethanolamine phosphate transferase 2 C-terminal domain-containing protein n=1 Tax=Phytophthora aleatoria TaxID=2496075 RepID=A0A8J5JCT1_9STRA|nr:hypothetical protein JG688_00001828 [Phytophthora aleatoria]